MIGKVLVLCLVIFGVMALAPKGERPARSLSGNVHEITPEPPLVPLAGAGAGATATAAAEPEAVVAPESAEAQPGTDGPDPVPQARGTSVSFESAGSTPAGLDQQGQTILHLGALDAPADARARMRAQSEAKQQGQMAQAAGEFLYVTAKRVNLRAGPSTKTAVLGRFKRGTKTELLSLDGNGWAEIRNVKTGLRGFMSRKFLSPKPM